MIFFRYARFVGRDFGGKFGKGCFVERVKEDGVFMCFRCVFFGRWYVFQVMVVERRGKVDLVFRVYNYCVDCEEISKWIMDKTKVVEFIKDFSRDLVGVIVIQRKLLGLEYDVIVIKVRTGVLERESLQLMELYFEQRDDIGQRQKYVEELWQGLQRVLEGQEVLLGEVSQLQVFLQDLDNFQFWLFVIQKVVVFEDIFEFFSEVEQFLQQYAVIKDDIDRY